MRTSISHINYLVLTGCLLAMIFAFTVESYAGGWSVNDAGATRVGMYAVIPKVTDLSAIFHNVANIASVRGTEFHFSTMAGFATADFKIQLTDPMDSNLSYMSDSLSPTVNYAAFPFLGAMTDFGLKRWKFGIANYFPNLTGGYMDEDAESRYHLIKGYFITNYTSVAVAAEITPQLYFGASIDVIYANQVGYRKFRHPLLPLQNDMRVYMDVNEVKPGYHLGFLYTPSPNVRFGISYFEETTFDLDGTVKMKTSGGEDAFGLTQLKTKLVMNHFIPRTIKMGMNFTINEKWNWGLDVYWWDYSKFETQTMLVPNIVKDLDFPDMPDVFDAMVAGLLKEQLERPAPKGYHDSLQVCAGVEYIVNPRWKVRGGIQYDDSPIPNETFSIEALTSDAYAFAAGFHYQINERQHFGFGYQHIIFTQRTINNSKTDPPTNGRIIQAFTDSILVEWAYNM